MNKTSPQKTEIMKIRYGVLFALLMVIITLFVVMYLPQFKMTKTMHCRFVDNDSIAPVHKCGFMKIVTTDMEEINFTKLLALEIDSVECTKNLEELAECPIEHLYYSYYPLDLFCADANCTVDGHLCALFSIEYYTNQTDYIEFYEGMFMQEKYNNTLDWKKAYADCKRIGG